MGSSSSDLSIESLLKNLRTTSNPASIPSTSSSIYANKQNDDEHELFAQAVQAIITSDESQLQTSTSSAVMLIDDHDKTNETSSDDFNKNKVLLDKYDGHSSEDRDRSLEDLISRLIANQQTNQCKSEMITTENQQHDGSLIIDDLVDDVLSSISSVSLHTIDDQRSASPEIAQLLLLNRNIDQSNEQKNFLEEKRLIEQELELIRRERENLLEEHEKYRQQITQPSLSLIQQQPPPPPSLLRAKISHVAPNEIHELSTIQEVDTPVSSRNTSLFHHRSPLKSSLDLQQLERISSAGSASSTSSGSVQNEILSSQPPLIINHHQQQQQQQQQQAVTNGGLERDDSGISLIDGPRSSATSRTTLAGGCGGGGGRSSSSGIQSLLTNRQPRVRTITNETTTTNTSISAINLPVVITTPRSNTESDDQSLSSVSRKWRDILANECLPQLPQPSSLFNHLNNDNQIQLTDSLGFGPTMIEDILPSSTTNNRTDSMTYPNQEQYLRSQYDNEQCDLMSLIKVHEYLTKQQHHPLTTNPTPIVDQLMSTSTPPAHHQSYSTLTSVTYRSSLAKQPMASTGPPISTPSHTSFSSADIPINHNQSDEHERRNSIVSDIHHLTHSPNTFETSITSNSSANSNKHRDTLSYLIEQNQRAMQRLIANPLSESTTFYSSTSMRQPEYESGALTTTTIVTEPVQHKTTLIETGSLSTIDFPSAILHADEHAKLDTKVIDNDEHGILEEPSLTLLSNSYRSLTTTATTTTGQNPPTILALISSQKQQKKKQCSSPLSNYDDKTSACSTPSLSPIKNEGSTPVIRRQSNSNHLSPVIRSTNSSSVENLSSKQKNRSNDNTSLMSFERHELSAGNATLSTTSSEQNDNQLPIPSPSTTNKIDPSYFPSVKRPSSSSSSSSSSISSSSSEKNNLEINHNFRSVEFFVDGMQQGENSARKLTII